MDSGRDTARLSFGHWAGTLDQLVHAARHAADEIAKLMPLPEGYDPQAAEHYNGEKHKAWTAAQEARELLIVVSEKEDFTAHPRDLDDLASLSETSIRSVEGITIIIGSTYRPPSVVIRCGSRWVKTLFVEIEGFDRTWTAGIKHELSTILKPQSRLHAPLLGNRSLAVVLGAVAFGVTSIGFSAVFADVANWAPTASVTGGRASRWLDRLRDAPPLLSLSYSRPANNRNIRGAVAACGAQPERFSLRWLVLRSGQSSAVPNADARGLTLGSC